MGKFIWAVRAIDALLSLTVWAVIAGVVYFVWAALAGL